MEKSPMLMSVVERQSDVQVYPDLAGARVLITGLLPELGVDVARAFADHKARLVVQSPEDSPAMTEVAAMLSETAAEIKVFNEPFATPDEAVSLVQGVVQDLGGLDSLINIICLEPDGIARDASPSDVEDYVADKLLGAVLATRVAANRMRLTLTEGSILNVVAVPGRPSASSAALTDIAYATLAAMTRGEAKEWADQGIRINAVGPRAANGSTPASGVDIAALALYLASKKGRGLSGHMLDAGGTATRRC
jgi:NAD(P)-dependent dehydrogenase (short-subunit alcohol dehydrogenase family)